MTLKKTGFNPIILREEPQNRPEVKKSGKHKASSRRLSSKDAVMLGLKTSAKGMIPAGAKKLAKGEKPTKYEALQLAGTIAIYGSIAAGGGPLLLGARALKYGALGVQHREKLAGLAKAAAKKLNPKQLAKSLKNLNFRSVSELKKYADAPVRTIEVAFPDKSFQTDPETKTDNKTAFLIIAGAIIGAAAIGLLSMEAMHLFDGALVDTAANNDHLTSVTSDNVAGHHEVNSTNANSTEHVVNSTADANLAALYGTGYSVDTHTAVWRDITTEYTDDRMYIYVGGWLPTHIELDAWSDGLNDHFSLYGHDYIWKDGQMYLEGGLKNVDNLSPASTDSFFLGDAGGRDGTIEWYADGSNGPLITINGAYYQAWPDGDMWHFNSNNQEYVWKDGHMYSVADTPEVN